MLIKCFVRNIMNYCLKWTEIDICCDIYAFMRKYRFSSDVWNDLFTYQFNPNGKYTHSHYFICLWCAEAEQINIVCWICLRVIRFLLFYPYIDWQQSKKRDWRRRRMRSGWWIRECVVYVLCINHVYQLHSPLNNLYKYWTLSMK